MRDGSFPAEWRSILERRMFHWRRLDHAERLRLEALISEFLGSKQFEGARGFDISTEMEVVVSGQACLLVLGLDLELYRDVTSIILHPSTAVRRGERHLGGGIMTDDPVTLSGEARMYGPVMIAWDQARSAARHPRGYNVAFHEFAHKIDMHDGTVDGTPLMPDADLRRRWVEVCTQEYRVTRSGAGFLDPYGGTNPGEFFAVATEAFFDAALEMEAEVPALYEVFRSFYRQDPAERARRGGLSPR